ncbi:MAG: hypothetical protein FWE83_03635 [Oscillospiraceae bacterium]|nr:hypothetical protein [Oscillospiraceae bacterium]
MEVSYKLLNHKEPLTEAEIEKLYDDNWVFIVNVQYSDKGEFVSGIPVVCGNCAYAGASAGIYDQFDAVEYGEHTELYLFKPELFTILEKMREAHA